jgi:hypothetical protein
VTWSELIQHGAKFAPNADVYLSVDTFDLMDQVVRVNYPLAGIRKEGQLVFLDGDEAGE